MTVDVCHAALTHTTSHEALYVAATRGRDGNHLWVATDSDRDVIRDPEDLPAPEQVLSHILERRDPDRLSAHQAIDESLADVTGLARLGQIFEDAARTATDAWLAQLLTSHGLATATSDPEWPTLVTTARQTALAGHNLDTLVDDAIRMRPFDNIHSTAAILDWRLGNLMHASTPVRARGPLTSLPPTDGPAIAVARQAGELIRDRWRQIRSTLDTTTDMLPSAPSLGAPPIDAADRMAWLNAATAITAYRERYQVPDHLTMIGTRPSGTRPDAQAAWDHACHQADRYLARRLHDLTNDQLNELEERQLAHLGQPPHFDPAQLEDARQAPRPRHGADTARDRGDVSETAHAPRLRQLEGAAARRGAWEDTAEQAHALRRQIARERQRRTRDARTR